MSRSKGKTEDDWLFEYFCRQIADLGKIGRLYVRSNLMEWECNGQAARAEKMRRRLQAWDSARKKGK